MKKFVIQIIDDNKKVPKLVPKFNTMEPFGVINDNETRVLEFIRPEDGSRNDSMLILYFRDGNNDLSSINIGHENTFIIPNGLTQTEKLNMHISFSVDGVERESSKQIVLRFLKSNYTLDEVEEIPDEVLLLQKKVVDLEDNAWYGEYVEEEEYFSIKNKNQEEIVQLPKGSGGGSSVVAWLPDISDEFDLSWTRSTTTVPPETKNIKGKDGREVVIRVENGFIQWKYFDAIDWENLISLELLIGPSGTDGQDGNDGETVELRQQDNHIQWKFLHGEEWFNLLPLEMITGPKGEDGKSIQILGSYDTYEEFIFEHPIGIVGEGYLVAGDLYVWIEDSNDWQNVGTIQGPSGKDGREIELRVGNEYVQWRYLEETQWTNLMAISTLIGPKGETGENIELRAFNGYIQWKITSEVEWINLVSLDTLKGEQGISGKEIELQKSETHVQWRYVGDSNWINLILLEDIVGEKGQDGEPGTNGKEIELRTDSTHIQWKYVGDSIWNNLILLELLRGPIGENGNNGREVVLRLYNNYVQWQYAGESSWTNLIPLSELIGPKGERGDTGYSIELEVIDNYIQWRVEVGDDWHILVPISDLKGEPGTEGLSAYASAQIGGYSQDENTFYADLAAMQRLAAELAAI